MGLRTSIQVVRLSTMDVTCDDVERRWGSEVGRKVSREDEEKMRRGKMAGGCGTITMRWTEYVADAQRRRAFWRE